MKENNLRHIDGKKIRQPWFGFLLTLFYAGMLIIPYFILTFTILLGKYNPADWPSTLWMSVYLGFFFSLPFLLLRILSRHCFGKILCVLTEEGIHHPTGMLRWDDVERIEYAIDEKARCKDDNGAMFRSVFYTKNGKLVVIPKIPLHLLFNIKKRKGFPVTVTGVSTILALVLVTAAWILPVSYGVFLLRNAPGFSTAQALVALALTFVLYIARRLVTAAYQIDYRVFRWILPKKWLYYVMVWHEVAAIYLGILFLAYHPTWWGIALTGLYLGLGTGWIRRPGGYGRSVRFWSYEQLYERYITKSELWEKEIQRRRAKREKRRGKK